MEFPSREPARKRVHPEFPQGRTFRLRFPGMHPAEMTAISESKHAFSELQRHIHVHAVLARVRSFQQLLHAPEPDQLPVKTEMHFHQSAIHLQKQVFAAAKYVLDAPALDKFCRIGRELRLQRDRMKHMQAPDALPLYQWAQGPRDRFHFRKFWHEVWGPVSVRWLQRQQVL